MSEQLIRNPYKFKLIFQLTNIQFYRYLFFLACQYFTDMRFHVL